MLVSVVNILPVETPYLVTAAKKAFVTVVHSVHAEAPVKSGPHDGPHRRIHSGRIAAACHNRYSFDHKLLLLKGNRRLLIRPSAFKVVIPAGVLERNSISKPTHYFPHGSKASMIR
jgi:hypothetical protein